MEQVKINSIVKFGCIVYVKCDDIIKSLYHDLMETQNPETQQYIKANIRIWEEYEESILEQAKYR